MLRTDMDIREQSISLNGLRFYAYHGVMEQEAVVGAWYRVNLTIRTDTGAAVRSDDLSGTVNYAQVVSVVKEQMQIRSALLEHLAGRIAQALLDTFPTVESLTVTVIKEHPPVDAPCHEASFTLTVSGPFFRQ